MLHARCGLITTQSTIFSYVETLLPRKFTSNVLGKLVVSLMLYVIINIYRHVDTLLQFYKDFYQHLDVMTGEMCFKI